MKKVLLLGTVAVLFLLLVMGTPNASAATTCTFTTVGTTMTLDGDCTTDETILIPDGFTLDGAGNTITAVDPSGGHFTGAVIANAGSVAHVKNLTVTASGLSNVCDGGGDRLRGIMFEGASGSITHNTVTGINQGASGCQEGNAVEVRNAPFDGTHPDTKTVTVTGNTLKDYQKNGITANGDVFATIKDNHVTGSGPVDFIAQNGIQIGYGGQGEVSVNKISNHYYTGCSHQDAAKTGCTPWVDAGLLLYDVEAKLVKHSKNEFKNNQSNVLLLTSQSLNPGVD